MGTTGSKTWQWTTPPNSNHLPEKQTDKLRKGTRDRFGSIRRLPSGRFQARYTDAQGTRINAPTTFQTKGDAATWLAMESAAITVRRWRPSAVPEPEAPLFRDYAWPWLAARELKDRTRSEYRKLLEKIVPAFEDVAMSDITPVMVRAWYSELECFCVFVALEALDQTTFGPSGFG